MRQEYGPSLHIERISPIPLLMVVAVGDYLARPPRPGDRPAREPKSWSCFPTAISTRPEAAPRLVPRAPRREVDRRWLSLP